MGERLPYCGYCGAKMVEVFDQDEQYDRRTGKRAESGFLYWKCSNYRSPELYHDGHWHDSEYVARLPSRYADVHGR